MKHIKKFEELDFSNWGDNPELNPDERAAKIIGIKGFEISGVHVTHDGHLFTGTKDGEYCGFFVNLQTGSQGEVSFQLNPDDLDRKLPPAKVSPDQMAQTTGIKGFEISGLHMAHEWHIFIGIKDGKYHAFILDFRTRSLHTPQENQIVPDWYYDNSVRRWINKSQE